MVVYSFIGRKAGWMCGRHLKYKLQLWGPEDPQVLKAAGSDILGLLLFAG